MKNSLICCISISLFAVYQLPGADIYVYQEPLGARYPYPFVVNDSGFLGVRFDVNQPWQLTSLQTEMTGPSTFFAALVTLPSVTSLPTGNPFVPGEVLYSTAINIPTGDFTPKPLDIPFNVEIDPGAYAIVIGGGFLGANGPIYPATFAYYPAPGSTAFAWNSSGFETPWNDISLTLEMSVLGTPIPEPNGMCFFGLGLLIILSKRALSGEMWVPNNRMQ